MFTLTVLPLQLLLSLGAPFKICSINFLCYLSGTNLLPHTIPLSRTPDPNAPNKHSFNYNLNKAHFKMHNAKRSL